MNEAYEFLNLYKRLEDLLEARLAPGEMRRGSVVVDFMNSAAGAPYREQLNLCREIRNVMTHNADLEGEPVVLPSQAVVEHLKSVVEAVERPPLAIAYATPRAHLMTARRSDRVLELMRRMEERGFSHVPVLSKGCVEGVFSVSTVFSAAMREGAFVLDETARVSLLEPLLPPEKHLCESFRFVRDDISLSEACEAFEARGHERHKRVAALFLSADGTQRGELRAMLTPWDLIAGRYEERQKRKKTPKIEKNAAKHQKERNI